MIKKITLFQRLNWGQILTILLIGLLLFTNTACTGTRTYARTSDQAPAKSSSKTLDQMRPEIPQGAANSELRRGMNDYSNVDPRFDTSRAAEKSSTLQERVKENLNQKRSDRPEKFVENYRQGAPLSERTQKFTQDVESSVKEAQEGLVKGTQRGLENLQENTQKGAAELTEQAQQAAQTTTEFLEEATEATQEALEQTSKNMGKGIRRSAEDTSDYVQRRARDAAKQTRRTLEDAADAAS